MKPSDRFDRKRLLLQNAAQLTAILNSYVSSDLIPYEMKIECGKRKLSDGTMMYVDTRGRNIYFGGAECEPPYKIVFNPEKRGPSIDVEHEEFEKCLRRSKAERFLNETELERRIRRGRPVTVW